MERETDRLIYEKALDEQALKTIAAFANCQTGRIVFDRDADGMEDPAAFCRQAEDTIRKNLSPVPRFELAVNEENQTVILMVFQGDDIPYLYQGWPYLWHGSAVERAGKKEFQRMLMKGEGKTFDVLPSAAQNLTFQSLAKALDEKTGIEKLTPEVLRLLQLSLPDAAFTQTASLLSDQNPFLGIDVVRFGKDWNEIRGREILEQCSILDQYEKACNLMEQNYTWQVIRGLYREDEIRIPPAAFQEALINAILYRDWMIQARIRVSLFEDRLEILSPGALPEEMTPDLYLDGEVVSLRNPNLAYAFQRLSLSRLSGRGIRKIRKAYEGQVVQPHFEIGPHFINVVLPLIEPDRDFTKDQKTILHSMAASLSMTTKEIAVRSGFSEQKTRRILNQLLQSAAVRKEGTTRNTIWIRI